MLAKHYHKDIEVRRLGLRAWPRQDFHTYLTRDCAWPKALSFWDDSGQVFPSALVSSPVVSGCLAFIANFRPFSGRHISFGVSSLSVLAHPVA